MTTTVWIALIGIIAVFGAMFYFDPGFLGQTVPVAGGEGAHCGGFIRNAPTCAPGFHCQLKVSNPDTGGTCVKN